MRRTRATSSAATWQIASVLLGYPDDALAAHLPALAAEVEQLPDTARAPLRRFLTHAGETPTLDLARHFVETFDHKRRCCLYLTYYAHGDTRKRGLALLEFKTAYRAADRKSTRLNSSHGYISYAVFCLKKKKTKTIHARKCTMNNNDR